MRKDLLSAASNRRTITYGELMARFGLARGATGNTVVGMLGDVDRLEAALGAPGFAAIVVRKDTGYPGGGFFCWDDVPRELRRTPEKCKDPRLSHAEKAYVRQLQEKIWAYYGAREREG
jgi:hypothetical protein